MNTIDNIDNSDEKVLTPDEYFQIIKSKKQTISDNQLLDIYNNITSR